MKNNGIYTVNYSSQTCDWTENMTLEEARYFINDIEYGEKCSVQIFDCNSNLLFNKDMWENKADINKLYGIDVDLRKNKVN